MPYWSSYAYCEKCDRPLRRHEFKNTYWSSSGGNDGVAVFLCRYCHGGCWKAGPLGWVGALLVLSYILCLVIEPDKASEVFLLLLGGIACLVGYGVQMSKSKPIYERWVAKHGSAPDKWPGR